MGMLRQLGGHESCLLSREHASLMLTSMWRGISVAILLTCPVLLYSQTIAESTDKELPSRSQTYNDTLQTIKKWLESEGNDDLARLLRMGEARTPDLVAACRDSDEEIAGAAFEALLLLGKPECETCADSMSQMRGGLALACSENISEAAFRFAFCSPSISSFESHVNRLWG